MKIEISIFIHIYQLHQIQFESNRLTSVRCMGLMEN